MNRRHFLQASGPTSLTTAAAPSGAAAPTAAAADFEWAEAGVADMGRAMTEGRTSALVLVRAYGARIAAPTGGPAWLIDPVNGDAGSGPSATTPAAVAGYPHVTVPMGKVAGLPLGLSFFGGAWQDAKLLALALHFEQATRHRTPPAFRASALSA